MKNVNVFILLLLITLSNSIYAQKQFLGNLAGSNSKAMVQENSKIAFDNTYDKIGNTFNVPYLYNSKKTIALTLDSIQCYLTNQIPFIKKDNGKDNKETKALTYYFSKDKKTYKYRIGVLNGYAHKKYSLFFDEKTHELVIKCVGNDVKNEPIVFEQI